MIGCVVLEKNEKKDEKKIFLRAPSGNRTRDRWVCKKQSAGRASARPLGNPHLYVIKIASRDVFSRFSLFFEDILFVLLRYLLTMDNCGFCNYCIRLLYNREMAIIVPGVDRITKCHTPVEMFFLILMIYPTCPP